MATRDVGMFRILWSVSFQRLSVALCTHFPCMNYTEAINNFLIQILISCVVRNLVLQVQQEVHTCACIPVCEYLCVHTCACIPVRLPQIADAGYGLQYEG